MMNSADTQIDVNANTVKAEPSDHFGNSVCENENMENHGYVRKRTRATAEQLAVLEDTFVINVSPNSKLRKQLSEQLNMSERSIQIWFQNRRAKVKHVQKRAQMQMQQAAIRAQLYHYHQQHYGQSPFSAPPMIPMQPNLFQQQPPQVQVPPQQPYFYPAQYIRRVPLPRAQSVDAAVSYYNPPSDMMARSGYPPTGLEPFAPTTTSMNMSPISNPSSWSVPPTVLDDSSNTALSRQSMPPFSNSPLSHSLANDASSSDFSNNNSAKQVLSEDLKNFVHGQMSPSPGPTENGNNGFNYYTTSPTIGLAEEDDDEEKFISTEPPISQGTSSPEQDLWSSSLYTNITDNSINEEDGPSTASASPKNSATTATVNPSNIMMTGSDDTNSCNFNISALTVGAWHRVKLHSSDLICCYDKYIKGFVWYIVEGGCRFKIEVHLASVSSIEHVPLSATAESLAEVHVYMTQPPLFYMESASSEKEVQWMQCSDFTENKQASRYMRHVLKGASKTLKQDLMMLISQQEELKSLVKFSEDTITPLLPSQQQKQMYMPLTSAMCQSPSMYSWPTPSNMSPNFMSEQFVACGFYS